MPAEQDFALVSAFRVMRRKYRLDPNVDTQFSDAWLVLAVLLILLAVGLDNQFLLGAAVILLVVAGASWVWNQISLFGLHYERRLSETRAFVGETVQLTLEVRNRKFVPLSWLTIEDTFPARLPVDSEEVVINPTTNFGEFRTFWMLGAFQRVTRSFEVQCVKRGYHYYGPARVNSGDGFGLFSFGATLPRRDRLIVYPRIYSAEELQLPAKNPFGVQGSPRPLFDDPLRTAGIREWRPSDSLRRVHWKASARHQRMLSRIYEPSQEAQTLIVLNVATLPRHWQGHIPELQERAVSVAASLAALCSDWRLPVGLLANGHLPGSDQALRILPGRSPYQLVRILELLAAVTPFATHPIEDMLLRDAPRLPWGAGILVVSAVTYAGLSAALCELYRAGRQVVLFTLAEDAPSERLKGIPVYHLPHLVEDIISPQKIA
jgi:uncharacterized protein (DUF58 family)